MTQRLPITEADCIMYLQQAVEALERGWYGKATVLANKASVFCEILLESERARAANRDQS